MGAGELVEVGGGEAPVENGGVVGGGSVRIHTRRGARWGKGGERQSAEKEQLRRLRGSEEGGRPRSCSRRFLNSLQVMEDIFKLRPTGDSFSLVNPTVLLRKFGGSEGGADVPVEGRACGGGGGGIQDEAGVDGACGRRSTCEQIEQIEYIIVSIREHVEHVWVKRWQLQCSAATVASLWHDGNIMAAMSFL